MDKFLLVVLAGALFVSGCTQYDNSNAKQAQTTNHVPRLESTPHAAAENPNDWRDAVFTDVATGKVFRISDFKGQTVLLESFAVWCPVCLEQQKIIRQFEETEGASIVSVSLDTDPNENESLVRKHVSRNNLNWFFAVSPIASTRQLIDEFGRGFVYAPGAPVVLVCKDQSARMLRSGVKSAADLKEEIRLGC